MIPPKIRPADEQDGARLAVLSGQLGYPATPEQVAERLAAILARPNQAVFVAEVGGQVAGWVHVYACPTVESDLCAGGGGLVVDESRRGQGVGKALMAQAEKWSRGRGIREVRLRSNVIRKGAHHFYESLGYQNIKTQFTFYKPL